jgi:glycerate dehydrogenase
MKILFLDGGVVNPGDLSWNPFKELGELEVFDRTSEDEIVSRARDAEVLLTTRAPLSAATITKLERLRYIGVVFTGYDQVDLKAARARGIPVTNVPTYGTASVGSIGVRTPARTLSSRGAAQPSKSRG